MNLFSINWEVVTHRIAIGHLGFNSSLIIKSVCVLVVKQQHRESALRVHAPLCAITPTPNWHGDMRKTKRCFDGY